MTTAIAELSMQQAFVAGEPGFYENIPAEMYHALSACSASRLKKLARSPLHCKESIDHPGAPTPAMVLGSAEHCAVLQPELFEGQYIFAEQCAASKKNGERCENGGKLLINSEWRCGVHCNGNIKDLDDAIDARVVLAVDDYAKCKRMHAAVWSHPAAKKALAAPGPRELSVLWVDKATGQLCKIRVDALGERVAWDVKTCADASPEQFAWAVRKFGYDISAAFYLRGLAESGLVRDGYGFIPVESEPPHAVAMYTLNDEDLFEADSLVFGELLPRYADCSRGGNWPGYGTGMQVLKLPRRRAAMID